MEAMSREVAAAGLHHGFKEMVCVFTHERPQFFATCRRKGRTHQSSQPSVIFPFDRKKVWAHFNLVTDVGQHVASCGHQSFEIDVIAALGLKSAHARENRYPVGVPKNLARRVITDNGRSIRCSNYGMTKTLKLFGSGH